MNGQRTASVLPREWFSQDDPVQAQYEHEQERARANSTLIGILLLGIGLLVVPTAAGGSTSDQLLPGLLELVASATVASSGVIALALGFLRAAPGPWRLIVDAENVVFDFPGKRSVRVQWNSRDVSIKVFHSENPTTKSAFVRFGREPGAFFPDQAVEAIETMAKIQGLLVLPSVGRTGLGGKLRPMTRISVSERSRRAHFTPVYP